MLSLRKDAASSVPAGPQPQRGTALGGEDTGPTCPHPVQGPETEQGQSRPPPFSVPCTPARQGPNACELGPSVWTGLCHNHGGQKCVESAPMTPSRSRMQRDDGGKPLFQPLRKSQVWAAVLAQGGTQGGPGDTTRAPCTCPSLREKEDQTLQCHEDLGTNVT